MSHKRKATELAGEKHEDKRPEKKHRFSDKRGSKGHKQEQHGDDHKQTTSLKRRARDLRRLLEHVDNEPANKMPANVRVERERELEACEHELEERNAAAREAEHRTKMISKYHYIRFLERRKTSRILKKLQRELSTIQDRSKKATLQQRIHNAKVDLNYTQYYPHLKPYVSLFPKEKQEASKSQAPDDEEEGEVRTQKAGQLVSRPKGNLEIWKAVEEAMEEETLDALRDSKPGAPPPSRKDDDTRSAEKKRKKDKKKPQSGSGIMRQMLKDTKAAATQEAEDDSDGGFFE
ncbi:hypothetical protein EJ04DRAFT_532180 [Polyplosphaeria fusca]|uniref:rRNA-processing protein EFG1 n=1 Tax=Polyplosphaeria fusca TaxID=682080 RepID=A0A9P4V7S3_9PLEO|nr:hypothetical protein EJ04DRAFT_532180 [Polyplosphaeria fusca]